MHRVILLAGFLVAEFCGGLPAFAGTCALCREALSSGGGEGLIRGFYLSILLIAGMPLLIFAAVAALAWRVAAASGRRTTNPSWRARRAKQLPVVEQSEPS